MKYIIASDIHGVSEYMEKLDQFINYEQDNLDGIILLGDLLNNYRYYEPEEVEKTIELLNKHFKLITCVRGNGDSSYDQERLLFDCLTNYKTIEIDGITFHLTHGHLSEYDSKIADKNAFVGHTHVYNLEGNIINPGSVGLPRHGSEHTCILYDNKKLYLIDLDSFQILAEKNV